MKDHIWKRESQTVHSERFSWLICEKCQTIQDGPNQSLYCCGYNLHLSMELLTLRKSLAKEKQNLELTQHRITELEKLLPHLEKQLTQAMEEAKNNGY